MDRDTFGLVVDVVVCNANHQLHFAGFRATQNFALETRYVQNLLQHDLCAEPLEQTAHCSVVYIQHGKLYIVLIRSCVLAGRDLDKVASSRIPLCAH